MDSYSPMVSGVMPSFANATTGVGGIAPLAIGGITFDLASLAFITPTTGLADLNVRGGYQFDTAGKIIAVYHLFSAVEDGVGAGTIPGAVSSGDDYGSEFDIAYSVKVPNVNNLGLLVKGAVYMDDDQNNVTNKDTTLAWVQLDYKFSTK